MAGVGNLEEEAFKRKERLQSLKIQDKTRSGSNVDVPRIVNDLSGRLPK